MGKYRSSELCADEGGKAGSEVKKPGVSENQGAQWNQGSRFCPGRGRFSRDSPEIVGRPLGSCTKRADADREEARAPQVQTDRRYARHDDRHACSDRLVEATRPSGRARRLPLSSHKLGLAGSNSLAVASVSDDEHALVLLTSDADGRVQLRLACTEADQTRDRRSGGGELELNGDIDCMPQSALTLHHLGRSIAISSCRIRLWRI